MKRVFLKVLPIYLLSFVVCAQQLEIHHLDVGQGDATLIKSPTGITMLIDGGNTNNGTNIILPYLSSLGITSLDYIICSHYHADHLGGLDEVIDRLGSSNIGAIYDRGTDAPLPAMTEFNEYTTAANTTGKRKTATLGLILDLGGGVSMKCVATDGKVINYGVVSGATASENDLSVGWLLTYNSFKYFTGGDLGGESVSYADNETPLGPEVGDINVFKVNHHGSQYSTNQSFLNILKPEVAIIEAGNGNFLGCPVQATLNRLISANCYIYQTELGTGGTLSSGKGAVTNDAIIVKTSGSNFTVTYGSTTDTYKSPVDVTPFKGEGNLLPDEYILSQNYPNPFNPGTTIQFSLPKSSFVTLNIYDFLGQEVAKLVSQQMSAGIYTSEWNASDFSSGVYFYRLYAVPMAQRDLVPASGWDGQASSFTETKKLILLR